MGCSLCAAACPADCIRVVAAGNTPENRVSAGERYAAVYEINLSRCIFCGYCEAACPFDAITMGHDYELSDYNRSDLIFTKEMLLHRAIGAHTTAVGRRVEMTAHDRTHPDARSRRATVATPDPCRSSRVLAAGWVAVRHPRARGPGHARPRSRSSDGRAPVLHRGHGRDRRRDRGGRAAQRLLQRPRPRQPPALPRRPVPAAARRSSSPRLRWWSTPAR